MKICLWRMHFTKGASLRERNGHGVHISGMPHKLFSELVWINDRHLKCFKKYLPGMDCPLVNVHERLLKGTECCFVSHRLS